MPLGWEQKNGRRTSSSEDFAGAAWAYGMTKSTMSMFSVESTGHRGSNPVQVG